MTVVLPRAGERGQQAERARFAFVIATLNGASTIASSVRGCAGQADTYVVSDGSTDDTVAVALAAGATMALQLDENVGKPAAIHHLVTAERLLDRYDLICIVDDDTVVAHDFVEVSTRAFAPGVAVVCTKTASDWTAHEHRWNPIIGSRAFAYWKYQTFIRRGQSALGVMNCISGSNSVYRSSFLRDVLRPDTPYVVDDTYWVLEAQRRRLGRIVYCPQTSARIQEPTSVRAWYKQNLRWMWGTFQGIRGHRVGRSATKFDIAYLGLLLDWLLFTLVTPVLMAFLLVVNRDDPATLVRIGILYTSGYALWATIGALALRKWRLFVLFPLLMALDWIARVNLVHAAIKAIRQPTAACRWESPERYAAAA